MAKAQEWLDKEYPVNKRNEIEKLDLKSKGLEGELNFNGFDKLEELIISDNISSNSFDDDISYNFLKNEITSLDLTGTPKLKKLVCKGNSLKTLDLNNNRELVELDCSNNKLIE